LNDQTIEREKMDLLHSQHHALLEISQAIASHRELNPLFHDLAPCLHRVLEFDFANLILYEPGHQAMKSHVLETLDPNYTCPPGECPMETPGAWVRDTQQPWVTSDLGSDTRFPELARWLGDRGIRSLCIVPPPPH
jgi:formate hydrogenlyase transcriptional activator